MRPAVSLSCPHFGPTEEIRAKRDTTDEGEDDLWMVLRGRWRYLCVFLVPGPAGTVSGASADAAETVAAPPVPYCIGGRGLSCFKIFDHIK